MAADDAVHHPPLYREVMIIKNEQLPLTAVPTHSVRTDTPLKGLYSLHSVQLGRFFPIRMAQGSAAPCVWGV